MMSHQLTQVKIILSNRNGGINFPLLVLIAATALMVGLLLPHTFQVSRIPYAMNGAGGCGVKVSDAVSYTAPTEEIIPVDPNDRHYKHKNINENVTNLHLLTDTSYKHIRTKLPVYAEQFQTDPGDQNLENHFIPWGTPQILQNGKTYKLYYPNWATDVFFGSHFTNRQIMMNFGFMIGVELDKTGQPQIVTDNSGKQYEIADVFQDVNNPTPMPEEIFTKQPIVDTADDKGCIPLGNTTTSSQSIVTPTGQRTTDEKELQLKTFSVIENKIDHVWNVDCKPAIYLYPPVPIPVNVTVGVKGLLTYTTPLYNPLHGWNVVAYPDGSVFDGLKRYPYLYYEAKVADSAVHIPTDGYVEQTGELPNLFSEILPELGLSRQQIRDFTEYWMKALPKSPYYFVGIMDRSAIDTIESLTVIPHPDSITRVRLYFKQLDKPVIVTKPQIPIRTSQSGFSVVEWGGLVKRDMNHPFTCSQ